MTAATAVRRLGSAWRTTRSTVARRLFLDRQAEFWLGQLDPVRSLVEARARVLRVIDETPDTRTFVLAPNARWRGHRAGQYAMIDVELEGVRVRRCYSISSAPGEAHVAITVKRVPGGRVSGWLHDHLAAGDVVRLGRAEGDFVLPEPVPGPLLLLSGGAGITPVMSILRELAARDAVHDVVFVHHARTRADVAFAAELDQLAARHPGLRLAVCLNQPGARGFDEARFTALVPDFAARTTFLCGPTGLMERVERLWAQAGAAERLRRERFVATPAAPVDIPPSAGQPVRLARSQREVLAAGPGSLLDQLERAGERPAHGCRIGICHTCKCTKRSGTVQNLMTGALSDLPDEEIQLCLSVPRSELELDL